MSIKTWRERYREESLKQENTHTSDALMMRDAMVAEIDDLRAAMHADQILLEAARESAQRVIAELEKLKQQQPIAYIRKDPLRNALNSAFMCEVTKEPRQDRIAVYLASGAQS